MARILIADDDTKVVSRNKAALQSSGHTVVTVKTSADALAEIARNAPDVVVLEAMLDGGMAGFDLARILARRYPEMPVIMLTRADEYLSDEELAAQDRDGWLPVARYLAKPVMPDVLAYEVAHLVEAAA